MIVILIYAVIVLIGDAGVVTVAAMVEHFSKTASLVVFFALFTLVFWIGWILAVRITERYLVRPQ